MQFLQRPDKVIAAFFAAFQPFSPEQLERTGQFQQVAHFGRGADGDIKKPLIIAHTPAYAPFDNVARYRYRSAAQLALETETLFRRECRSQRIDLQRQLMSLVKDLKLAWIASHDR